MMIKGFKWRVTRIGFEPMTYCLEGSCSIQLSYRTISCVLNLSLIALSSTLKKERAKIIFFSLHPNNDRNGCKD